eukprot:TRINITY_DN66720_c10_g1_i2.p1 TRINITY_DN66720_c10_g1~~TRINITY_DN66720_c10_g1_i2.p1  ORF type:complete len:471 (+),score=295.65 TRINITY_DN66720_c10_g1_i2:616-2028(+)
MNNNNNNNNNNKRKKEERWPEITLGLVRRKAEHHTDTLDTLEELSLHQLQIERINRVLGNNCKRLRILYLQNNLIPRIENVHKLKSLEYLNLALNNVRRIEGLGGCERLSKLDLTINFVDAATLRESLEHLAELPAIAELYMTGNPCTEWAGYRLFVIAMVPQLRRIDGQDITKTERILAKQSFARLSAELQRLAEQQRAKNRQEEQEQVEEEEEEEEEVKEKPKERSSIKYTPEARVKMYRDLEDEDEARRAREEEESKTTGRMSEYEAAKDPIAAARERMSAKVVPSSDGKLPPQRNTGRYPFQVREDKWGDVIVDIGVPKYLDTSEMDVDVHPHWFQVLCKGTNFLMHTPVEVTPDASKVQRLMHNGHLLLTLKRTHKDEANAVRLNKPTTASAKSNSGGGDSVKKSNSGFRNIVKRDDDFNAPPQMHEVEAIRSAALLAKRHEKQQEPEDEEEEDWEDDDDVPPLD